MAVNPIPKDYRATPYLICKNASTALEWYSQAFNATEVTRLSDNCGKIMHAEIRIGKSPVMLADEFPDMGYRGPASIGGSPVLILIYLENVDETFDRAIQMGANLLRPVSDQFDGDRRGTLIDPYGHIWILASRKEAVSFAEITLRFEKMMNNRK